MTLRSRRAALLTAFAVAIGGSAVAILPMTSSSAAVNCSAMAAWAEGASFTVGQQVSYNGRAYQAVVAHTAWAGTGWNPAATPTLWRDVDSCGTTPTTPPVTTSPTTRPPTTPPPTPSTTPPTTPPPVTGLPKRLLIGYHHTTFHNNAGYLRMADVPDAWDIINLSFGESDRVDSGEIKFGLCPVAECPNVESEAEFIAAVQAKRRAGTKVLLSIGGQNGKVQLTNEAAREKFVTTVSAIIDKFGLDGLDIDLEGHSLYLNPDDTDLYAPTTPVITNLIAAVKKLKAKYGDRFVLTMAPETFFVQLGHYRYGPGPHGGDSRAGAYLPLIHALKDILTVLHVQDYNSGPIMGLDGTFHTMGDAKFHVAMTHMLLKGFTVNNPQKQAFTLDQSQIAFGAPAAGTAGNGYVGPPVIQQAVNCLVKAQNCPDGYSTNGEKYPNFRGLMTWSINWDKYHNWEFQNNHKPFLNGLG